MLLETVQHLNVKVIAQTGLDQHRLQLTINQSTHLIAAISDAFAQRGHRHRCGFLRRIEQHADLRRH